MQKARYLVALSCAVASARCGTDVATAVNIAPGDSGPGITDQPPQPCTSTKLVDRLSYSSVSLPDVIRYKHGQYFFGLPQDDRIAFSALNNNVGMVAWVDGSGAWVHVTPLTIGPKAISRFGTDVLVPGTELSGLVALDDGFALLTRRTDPGDPLSDNMMPLQATFLVRWQDGAETFGQPLTGTKSIVEVSDVRLKRDFPNPITGSWNSLSGRLAFDGSHFGAYFSVRGAAGDLYEGSHADKFVEIDKAGQFVRSWRRGCRQSLGNRLVVGQDGFAAFCMSDGTDANPGPQLVADAWDAKRLAPENATDADYGGNQQVAYVGGNFGSALAIPSGYFVAWASRGVITGTGDNANPTAGYNLHEPAVAILDQARNIVPVQRRWPFLPSGARPLADSVNVHAGLYGDKVLLVWETITDPQFHDSIGYSTGVYGGTHFRLVDAKGLQASDEEVVPSAIAPNGQDDIVRLPNGDLVWALVPEGRDFQTVLPSGALATSPSVFEIQFVRLRYCIP